VRGDPLKAFILTMDAIMAVVLLSSVISVFQVQPPWIPSPLYTQLKSVGDVYERIGGDPITYMNLLGIKGGYILYDKDGVVSSEGNLTCSGPTVLKTVHRDRWYLLKLKGCSR